MLLMVRKNDFLTNKLTFQNERFIQKVKSVRMSKSKPVISRLLKLRKVDFFHDIRLSNIGVSESGA